MPPRGQQHSPELWAQILALWDLGLTIYKIATQLNVPPCTVSRLVAHANSGLQMQNLRRFHSLVTVWPLHPSSIGTISLMYQTLRSANVCACLDWARNHATWLAQDWRQVIFSEESKFNVFNGDGPLRCWRRPGLSLDPCYTCKQVKHGGGNVMVWGCVTANGVGHLYCIDGHLTAVHYTKILKEELCGTMADLSIPVCCTVFQHDNDPKHTAKVTQEWLNTQQLSVLPWPANSPYMNIIENVWDYLDRCVRMRHQLPTRANDLWAILQEEWECIPQAYIDKLYDSMTERVQEVIDRKGGNTCY
ncbi:Transposable element Tcb2 transposase [Rhizoctonia solani]|uniref:Transposable element Tcb2 transposase n=1 Tax=Rhizoctonia solani TaxID=456999 RepID=A0A8H8NN54_9AGAM|nr:Transposable element Tcb2 transposase [Rhizoctonia solani]QRW15697.1 Transposable element Tcb2 transposase [Rhizoctonia solani]